MYRKHIRNTIRNFKLIIDVFVRGKGTKENSCETRSIQIGIIQ